MAVSKDSNKSDFPSSGTSKSGTSHLEAGAKKDTNDNKKLDKQSKKQDNLKDEGNSSKWV